MPSATTTDGKVLDSRAANADAASYQKKMNSSRWMPPLPVRTIRAKEEHIHIFSVSPWQFPVSMAEWGMFIIPACLQGKEYVEFLMPDGKPIPGAMTYYFPQDEIRMSIHEEEGIDWANKLLNNDAGINRAYSLNRMGVFIAKGEKPTREELAAANAEVDEECTRLVQQAREWSTDPQKKTGISVQVHHVAARRLNLQDESWMLAANPQGRKKCKMCGTMSDPDVLKCGNCNQYVFDQAGYAALMAEQKAEAQKYQKTN